MADETYNGYPNKPTWTFGLWIDNDQGLQDRVREIVETAPESMPEYRLIEPYTADLLKEFCWAEIIGDDAPTGFIADLFEWALSRVDWLYLARLYRENYLGIPRE